MIILAKLLNPSLVLSDDTLRAQAPALDPLQFIGLYDEYFGRVYKYVRYRCEDDASSEDITALVFERALRGLDGYDPSKGSFGAWLFTIARNAVNNYFRTQKRQNWLPLEICGEHPDKALSPEENLIKGETQAELMDAISSLSERDRDLLSLKFAACLTNRRIAEITGLSENNVGVILYRAIHKLRVNLDEQ